MFIPTISKPISSVSSPQIRLLLIGKPGSGKTYTVVKTFPSVVIADFDNGLGNPDLRNTDAKILSFHDDEWVKNSLPTGANNDSRIAFKYWLNTEAKKLEAGQTLFVDSLSTFESSFHRFAEPHIPKTKDNKEDGYWIWGEKQKYLRDIHIIFKSLKCHVVVAAHEKEIRDPDSGILLGKVSPLLSGGFVEQIGVHYTDIFRAFVVGKRDKDGKLIDGCTYYWQLRPDDKYDLKSRMNNLPKLTDAPGFDVFKGYN